VAQTQAEINAAGRQAEIFQREQQDLLRQDQQRGKRILPPVGGADLRQPSLQPEAAQQGAACSETDEIVIEGGDLLAPTFLKQISGQFVGRCLGVADIELLLSLITQHYIERGYVTTRAYLPSQDLKTRRLRILVVEGVIESYRKEGDGAERIFVPGAFPASPGDKLNLRDLEQGVDQINRLASNNATIDIQPGSSPGKSIVIIRNKASVPVHANIGYDNLGSRPTGKQSASASLTVDKPLGLNERWLLTTRGSLPRDDEHNSDSAALDFSIPWGRSTFSSNVSHSAYQNALLMPSGRHLKTDGTTDTQSVALDRLLFRDQSNRLSFGARLSAQQARNYVADSLVATSSRNLSYLDLNLGGNTVLLGGVLSGQIGYSRGLTIFGALRDSSDLSSDAPRAQFEKATLDLNFTRSIVLFGLSPSWSSQFTGQYAETPLYGSQQILIGSTSSVRGFSTASLSGDRGYFMRNELSLPGEFSIASERVAGRVYVGFDFGRASGVASGSLAGKLSGATIGFAAQCRGAIWEFFTSRPLSVADGIRRETTQSWFRVSYAF
jgi:hemolysin activation/secretion protein